MGPGKDGDDSSSSPHCVIGGLPHESYRMNPFLQARNFHFVKVTVSSCAGHISFLLIQCCAGRIGPLWAGVSGCRHFPSRHAAAIWTQGHTPLSQPVVLLQLTFSL